VPVRAELAAQLTEHGQRMAGGVARLVAERRLRVEGLARGLPEPQRLIGEKAQRLDAAVERLALSWQATFAARRDHLARLRAGLRHPSQLLAAARHRLDGAGHQLQAQLLQALNRKGRALDRLAAELQPRRLADDIARRRLQLDNAAQRLDSVDYRRVLARGYVLVRGAAGQPVLAAAAVTPGAALTLHFADGAVAAVASGRAPPEAPKPPPKGGRQQGSLF